MKPHNWFVVTTNRKATEKYFVPHNGQRVIKNQLHNESNLFLTVLAYVTFLGETL